MPEHVHLLVSEPKRADLAVAIKSLKQGVARRLIEDTEHFWQKRYYDFNVRTHDQFVEKLRYIHRNPVQRGLCECPEDWEWSSFRHYATGGEGRVEIESEWTARRRERAAGGCAQRSHCPTQANTGLEWATSGLVKPLQSQRHEASLIPGNCPTQAKTRLERATRQRHEASLIPGNCPTQAKTRLEWATRPAKGTRPA